MLPKKNRAQKKEVERIFKEGRFINSPNLTFKFLSDGGPATRISFIAPKTVVKGAVGRNTLRRRGYNALAKYINDFPAGLLGAFVYKKPINTLPEVEEEISAILNKLK